jgi:probable phosphoglycerate mutase
MTKILVIRHGATDWNEAKLIQGRTDRPLSKAGRDRIRAISLPDDWARQKCLTSPLQRAIETAQLLGLDPRSDPRLIEMAWGAWEGCRVKDLRAIHGVAFDVNEAKGLDFRPPGGESPRDVQIRLRPLLSEIDAQTIFVTHKGVLRALYALAIGWDMTRDAPEELCPGRAHIFDIAPDGTPAVGQLNIALAER